jgi:hypothetical protein
MPVLHTDKCIIMIFIIHVHIFQLDRILRKTETKKRLNPGFSGAPLFIGRYDNKTPS